MISLVHLSCIQFKLVLFQGLSCLFFGSLFGIIRLIGTVGLFEVIKPELNQFSRLQRRRIKRSFYSYRHWLTMAQELINLNRSSQQVSIAQDFTIPIISIKSQAFFHPSILTALLPLRAIDQLRNKMHQSLSNLSRNFTEIPAANSSHFVWTDQPEIILQAVKQLIVQEP